jgi:hypothetical protein
MYICVDLFFLSFREIKLTEVSVSDKLEGFRAEKEVCCSFLWNLPALQKALIVFMELAKHNHSSCSYGLSFTEFS